ncbi:MAG: L,D-transpeptidase [Muribaculaceae bacterium]|nr:L,D-transpeptidase [Muribaculaceae bacterium]
MKLSYLYSLLILMAATACGSGHGDTSAADLDTIPQDTITLMDLVDEAAASFEHAPAGSKPDTLSTKLHSPEEAMEWMRQSDHSDEYMEGIIPRIAEQSLTYAEKLLQSRYPYFVIVDKGSMRVILYNRYGVEQKWYRMACSRNYGHKHKYRDNRTPEGFFYAKGVFDSREWKYTDDDGYTSPAKGVYGPRFIRLAPMVGLHGTNAPGSMGRRASHGCIRLTNANILDLVKYAQKGMPIIVNPGPKDNEVNKEEECDIVMLELGKSSKKETTLQEESAKKEPVPEKTDSTEHASTPHEHDTPAEVPEKKTDEPTHTDSPETFEQSTTDSE